MVHAETNICLNIQLYAGLRVTGIVGQVYQIQYAYGLSDTNTWYALQHFQLKWNPHDYIDTTCPATEQRFYRAVEVDLTTHVVPVKNMVFIPSGAFIMGSPAEEPARYDQEGPQTEVTISRGFWMGAYEVTQGEYTSLIGTNPSYFRNGSQPFFRGTGGAVTNELRHPVETVSWHDATNYCGQLTLQEVAVGRLPNGWVYRLPTEAEWEYTCRAGTTTAFHLGSALRSGMANFDGTREYPPCGSAEDYCDNPSGIYLGRTTEVGSYAPKQWGLYDMHGNVTEWCQDRWTGSLPGGHVVDPQGPATGSDRVIRGGTAVASNKGRSASRFNGDPDDGIDSIGFRIVLARTEP